MEKNTIKDMAVG